MDMLDAVKETLTKEVDVKEFLEMEIELTKLKELLATEVKLKEFLVQEIDLKKLLSSSNPDSVKTDVSDKGDAKINERRAGLDRRSDDRSRLPKESETSNQGSGKRELPAFDPSLIKSLQEEHQELRFIYDQLMRYAVDHDYEKVAGRLDYLNSSIREHYRRADTEMYAYLKTYIQIKHPKREKAFTQLSLEMKNISIEIFYSISQSPNIPLHKDNHSPFMKEFINLGKLMNERIIRETSVLFNMYEKTNEAKSIS